MCTLWQRFGRAGRNLALRGRALLLAEDKHFDAKKQAAKDKAADKRKVEDELTKDALTKKFKTSTSNADTSGADIIKNTISGTALKVGVEEYKQLRLLFNQVPAASRVGRVSQKTKVLEPVMDAFINAKTRPELGCYRLVVDAYFGNKNLSECDFAI